jgi:hypothetical protein
MHAPFYLHSQTLPGYAGKAILLGTKRALGTRLEYASFLGAKSQSQPHAVVDDKIAKCAKCERVESSFYGLYLYYGTVRVA